MTKSKKVSTDSKTNKAKKTVKNTKANTQDYTHISVVLDRSGSMSSIAKDMIGGFEKFLKDQKAIDGKSTITLAEFDDIYTLIHDFVDIKTVDSISLVPRGCTALLDAMGKTMNSVKEKIAGMKKKDRPDKGIFVFVTDGEENSSREFSREQVFALIEDFKKDKEIAWDFVFMGANQDAISAGEKLGIRGGASLTYSASSKGVINAYDSLSSYVTSTRCMSKTAAFSNKCSFSQDDRDKQDNT